ncbi:hypothetical protein PVIIG_05547 [Plasmodium vivax India VII]|uniref:Uncharacterized protein n=1 Tax=Plasmodium vivax India VII TaxID=1077284 RepID=A0A0J9SFI1_PLAVI|nr:hypothetical protein PVIIG_05547 [Plasmodium vivax India VII]
MFSRFYIYIYEYNFSLQHSNLMDLISLQYNLRMEKDNDEKYCVMMKILHQFFQYCKENIQYKKFRQEFKNEITSIRSGPENYKKNKEEYFKNLALDDSWISKARAIFQDSEAMSKNSPTIMSTLVSIILLFFFIYKVLKFFI